MTKKNSNPNFKIGSLVECNGTPKYKGLFGVVVRKPRYKESKKFFAETKSIKQFTYWNKSRWAVFVSGEIVIFHENRLDLV